MTTNEETDATNGETITWTITPRVYTGEWPDDIVDVENMREWTVDMPADADYSDLDILRACPDYRPVTEWALDARWVEEECVEYLRVVYEISADDYPPSEVEEEWETDTPYDVDEVITTLHATVDDDAWRTRVSDIPEDVFTALVAHAHAEINTYEPLRPCNTGGTMDCGLRDYLTDRHVYGFIDRLDSDPEPYADALQEMVTLLSVACADAEEACLVAAGVRL